MHLDREFAKTLVFKSGLKEKSLHLSFTADAQDCECFVYVYGAAAMTADVFT